MEQEKKRGGARPGAGRPRGSGHKITAQDLLDQAQATIGKPFAQSLMEGYQKSIVENNNKIRVTYEKMIIDKVIADRHQVETVESEDTIAAKQAAFEAALADITGIKKERS
jgi:hypothetical protein